MAESRAGCYEHMDTYGISVLLTEVPLGVLLGEMELDQIFIVLLRF